MKTILVASLNPVKIQAALTGFRRMFPEEEFLAEGVSVPSGVPHQPLTRAETLLGARNRAAGVSQQRPDADFCVGIEGGVEDSAEGLEGFAWVVILAGGREGKGCSGTFFLPPPVAELVRAGKELGEADDIVFGRTNSKQENGAVGILSGDVLDRARFYEQAVILALFPFKNPQLYLK